MLEAQDKARLCAQLAYEAKADAIVILDLRGISQITDFFVIASGDNARLLKAAARRILDALRDRDELPLGTEGIALAEWLLLDFNDVIVHLFLERMRRFYDLELLWGDAPRLSWQPPPSAVPRSPS